MTTLQRIRRDGPDRTTSRLVMLTFVMLIWSSHAIRADPAPQSLPEQDGPSPLLAQDLAREPAGRSTFGALANFSRNSRLFAALLYEGRHIYSLDGVRANHPAVCTAFAARLGNHHKPRTCGSLQAARLRPSAGIVKPVKTTSPIAVPAAFSRTSGIA
jgi:hypothetical protein